MKKLYHRGAPCHPPIVNGVTFAPSEEHPDHYVGEATPEQAAAFEGVPTFFDHPDNDPALAVEELISDNNQDTSGHDALVSENAALKAENTKLQEQVVDLTAKVDTLATENGALREQIAALEADEEEPEAGTDLDALEAEIKALEEKKAAGQTSASENMKLGKLKKKLEAALKR